MSELLQAVTVGSGMAARAKEMALQQASVMQRMAHENEMFPLQMQGLVNQNRLFDAQFKVSQKLQEDTTADQVEFMKAISETGGNPLGLLHNVKTFRTPQYMKMFAELQAQAANTLDGLAEKQKVIAEAKAKYPTPAETARIAAENARLTYWKNKATAEGTTGGAIETIPIPGTHKKAVRVAGSKTLHIVDDNTGKSRQATPAEITKIIEQLPSGPRKDQLIKWQADTIPGAPIAEAEPPSMWERWFGSKSTAKPAPATGSPATTNPPALSPKRFTYDPVTGNIQ